MPNRGLPNCQVSQVWAIPPTLVAVGRRQQAVTAGVHRLEREIDDETGTTGSDLTGPCPADEMGDIAEYY